MARPRSEEREKPLVKDAPMLERIHERFDYAVDRWKKIRDDAKIDMRHVAGDPWDPAERLARLKAKRPVIALDELSQYENQVVNDVRANPRAIKFSPVGDGANDQTARVYGDAAREMEYRSHAQQHYTRAFQNMVERSYGYVKMLTEFVTDKPAKPGDPWSAFNKRLLIQGCPDPDCIYPDPDFLDATGRDWRFLFEIESVTEAEFKLQYKDAAIQDFTPELVKYSNGWISGSGKQRVIRIASYWEREKTTKTLQAWQVTDPAGMPVVYELFDDDTDKLALVKDFKGEQIDEREVESFAVCQYRTNGVEILKKTPWPGKWIPYAACFGKMLWMDTGSGPELVILSMTRLARDPNLLHAYYTSCEAEMIGMTPKVPWWIWKGSLDKTNAVKVQKANHEPVPYIEIDPLMVNGGSGGQTPSLPQRIPFEPPIQAIEIGKEGARRSIQAAMGQTPLPTSAQRRNEKSGIALKQIEESGQRGSYHFIDSYDMMIERVGELFEDALPKVNDAAGELPVLDAQKRPRTLYVNANKLPQGQQAPENFKKEDVIPSLEGTHAVTIDVGPAYATERQQASDFVDTFVASPIMQALPPEMALQILALLVKLKNLGPIGEEIAEILNPNDEEQQMVPAQQLQQAVQTGEQIIQALQAKIQELEQAAEAKREDNEAKAAITKATNDSRERIAALQASQKQDQAELQSDTAIEIQKMKEALALLELRVEAQQADKDRAAGVMTKGAELEHKTAITERGYQESAREGRESRAATAREGDANRQATARENAANRQSADRNAAEDRKVKAQQAKQPKGAK